MHEECIAGLGTLSEPLEAFDDVLTGWLLVLTVIHQDESIVGIEPLCLEVLFYEFYIVVAASELALCVHVICARV